MEPTRSKDEWILLDFVRRDVCHVYKNGMESCGVDFLKLSFSEESAKQRLQSLKSEAGAQDSQMQEVP